MLENVVYLDKLMNNPDNDKCYCIKDLNTIGWGKLDVQREFLIPSWFLCPDRTQIFL